MKRLFDIIFSSIGIVFVIPLFVIITILIIIIDGGPVLFIQNRVGKNGKLFKLIKFRSMNYLESADIGYFELGNTNRVTKVGRFLRKFKIDELPQLINVMIGDMSIVGPRPEIKRWVDEYPERWAFVHRVKPGITDYAAIEFMNEEAILSVSDRPEEKYKIEILPRKLEIYEKYVREHSVVTDVKIIILTIYHILVK